MALVAPPGDQRNPVSNWAERPCPAGRSSSQARMEGCDMSGGTGAFASPASVASIRSLGRLNAMTGAPAMIRSASATAAGDASSVVSARASGPKPSAMAFATEAVFPQCDS